MPEVTNGMYDIIRGVTPWFFTYHLVFSGPGIRLLVTWRWRPEGVKVLS